MTVIDGVLVYITEPLRNSILVMAPIPFRLEGLEIVRTLPAGRVGVTSFILLLLPRALLIESASSGAGD